MEVNLKKWGFPVDNYLWLTGKVKVDEFLSFEGLNAHGKTCYIRLDLDNDVWSFESTLFGNYENIELNSETLNLLIKPLSYV